MSADTDGPWGRYIKMLKADIDGKDTYTLEERLVIYNETQIAEYDKVKTRLAIKLLDQLSGKPSKKIENS